MRSREVDDNEQPIRAPIYIGEQCVRGVQNAAMRLSTVQGRPRLIIWSRLSTTLARLASAKSTCRPRSDTCKAVVPGPWVEGADQLAGGAQHDGYVSSLR